MLSTNAKKIVKNLKNIGTFFFDKMRKTEIEKNKILQTFGRKVVNDIFLSMKNDPKTGNIYIIEGKRHQASAAGETPAILSGDLVRSLAYSIKRNQIEIGARRNVDYAKYLEQGTDKMAPRPYLVRFVKKDIGFVRRALMDRIIELKVTKGAGWYT